MSVLKILELKFKVSKFQCRKGIGERLKAKILEHMKETEVDNMKEHKAHLFYFDTNFAANFDAHFGKKCWQNLFIKIL